MYQWLGLPKVWTEITEKKSSTFRAVLFLHCSEMTQFYILYKECEMKRTVLQSERIAQKGPRRFRQIRWTILRALVHRANVHSWHILDRPKPCRARTLRT